ncbi:E3 ubiquitin-protein ligase WAV3-like [Ipomoea triloba]|uniref:E3 ubiquitin-protein ligase WAV3-like n=1 Tax=Ipomoea triloba TaxID=35885 RepID=UPI00125E68B2|nr:E3 ubiquitin-protein ligase WAV3-like [Ipomoea triloba]XP_031090549.1 E3 ubiquitin-protein ligase WAV3-like [Ipomoea triloba]
MGSTWRRAKQGLGLNLCAFVPTTRLDDDSLPSSSDAAPATSASHVIKLSRSISRSSKNTCAICLASMKRGDGHAIFIAECSHSFHFNCISSNVKHGNQVCPICRAKWKDIPLQCPSLDAPPGRVRVNPVDWPQNNALVTAHHSPRPHPNQVPEPSVFDDDESLGHQLDSAQRIESGNRTVEINMFPEVPSFRKFDSCDQFTALVHLKAPNSIPRQNNEVDVVQVTQSPRAPIDLVTVLDISGSMAGTKLALLKRAMGFVIQKLGPNDRLAVIAFSSTACRLFPLLRMSGRGRHKALQAVNSLVANGWTNIAQGLRKGAKIMEDRREKNPVASIILLSDGKDTPTVNLSGGNGSTFKIPVHTFGFGADHDASLMHRVSEVSGGTFSFIETESVIQDAFAQCIAGLLSVVVKELRLSIECVHPGVRVGSLRVGSYSNHIMPDGRMGFIDVGDLYADEERDFLVSINVPNEVSSYETSLLKVRCVYKDPLTREIVEFGSEELRIERPEVGEQASVSIEVDRHRNRLQAAEAMAQAQAAADKGDLVGATSVLENSRKALAMSVSAKSHDRLCIALDAELKEMQERMASRHVYEVSGRAYILSGLSSHSWQRATTRGDSTDESSLIWAYQTPSMIEMVTNSQAALLGSPSAQRLVRPVWSFGLQPNPR